MTIDTSALRQFQQIWEPVVKSIPALLDAAEREADLERGLAAKRRELDKVQSDIDASIERAENRIRALNADAAAILERKQSTQKEISEFKAAAAKEAAAAAQTQQEALSAAKAAVDEVTAQLRNLKADYEAKRASAEAEHAQRVAALNEEISQLASRKAAAEQALRDIRAKLG